MVIPVLVPPKGQYHFSGRMLAIFLVLATKFANAGDPKSPGFSTKSKVIQLYPTPKAQQRHLKALKSPKETEERLRARWNAFLAENSRQVDFDNATSSKPMITAVAGRDLLITCALNKPLRGQHRLSFIRLDDFSLLFVGQKRSIKDQRFQVLHNDGGPDESVWSLKIQNVKVSDSGAYECQINTVPKPTSHVVRVEVVTGQIWIIPSDPRVFVGAGGQLILDCILDTGPVKPQFILWYKDNKIVEYSDNVDAKVNLHLNEIVNDSSSTYVQHRSHLLVRNVSPKDSGTYRCGSDLTSEATVEVFVVREDFKSLHQFRDGYIFSETEKVDSLGLQ